MNRAINELPQSAIAFLFSVLSLDWKSVTETLVCQQNFSDEDAKNAIWKYACFLSLTFLYPHLTFIPTHSIDHVQHIFEALPTYAKSMNQLNHTIDHRPYEDVEGTLSLSQEEQFSQTKDLLQYHFGFLISDGEQNSDEISGCILRNAQYSGQDNIRTHRSNIT